MKSYTSRFFAFALAALFLASCGKKDTIVTPVPDTTTHKDTTVVKKDTTVIKTDSVNVASYSSIVGDTDFMPPVRVGTLTSASLPEASGLAASHFYTGMLWTENDSGNPNEIWLVDSLGNVRASFTLTGIGNRDWEDMAIGPGPIPGKSYIYLGEIGDNDAVHANSWVYRFLEPNIPLVAGILNTAIDNVDKIAFRYPDGPHNAETLMIDPLTLDIYVASKGAVANLYVARYPQKVDSIFTMTKLDILPLSTLTAGDISSTGREIVMKNYSTVYHWQRGAGETVAATLLRTPTTLPCASELKGESICFSPNNDAYYTTSEVKNGVSPGVFKYWRK